jgi:hypothetical protein
VNVWYKIKGNCYVLMAINGEKLILNCDFFFQVVLFFFIYVGIAYQIFRNNHLKK